MKNHLALLFRQGTVVGENHVLRLQWRNFGLFLSSLGAHLFQVCGEGGVVSEKLGVWWLSLRVLLVLVPAFFTRKDRQIHPI